MGGFKVKENSGTNLEKKRNKFQKETKQISEKRNKFLKFCFIKFDETNF